MSWFRYLLRAGMLAVSAAAFPVFMWARIRSSHDEPVDLNVVGTALFFALPLFALLLREALRVVWPHQVRAQLVLLAGSHLTVGDLFATIFRGAVGVPLFGVAAYAGLEVHPMVAVFLGVLAWFFGFGERRSTWWRDRGLLIEGWLVPGFVPASQIRAVSVHLTTRAGESGGTAEPVAMLNGGGQVYVGDADGFGSGGATLDRIVQQAVRAASVMGVTYFTNPALTRFQR